MPDDAPEAFARIDVQSIYNLLLTVQATTTRLEGKVDTFHTNLERIELRLTEQSSLMGALESRVTKLEASGAGEGHENRIRKLEAWKYAIPPSIAIAVASVVVAVVRGGP